MTITVELYKADTHDKVYISAEGATGADYEVNSTEDIGKKVVECLETYYPDALTNPNQ